MTIESVEAAKICTNCANIGTNGSGNWQNFRCFAEKNLDSETLNLVNGATIKIWRVEDCHSARKSEIYCGKSARWFKEKPPEKYLRDAGDRVVNREKQSPSLADKL